MVFLIASVLVKLIRSNMSLQRERKELCIYKINTLYFKHNIKKCGVLYIIQIIILLALAFKATKVFISK